MNFHSRLQPDLAPLCAALAGEMREIGAIVGALEQIVVSDEAFALAHVEALQQFDLVVQSAEETARVLERMGRGASHEEAVGLVRLEAIRARLGAAAGHG